jgi:serine/threonine-protein kinase
MAAWILLRRPPRTMFGLRVAEVGIVGPVVIVMLVIGVLPFVYDPLVKAAGLPTDDAMAYVGRNANAASLLWFFVITAYGTIIPNTLRRVATVTTVIALSPVALFIVYSHWVRPLEPAAIGMVLFGLTAGNIIAVVLVLFSTSRIEVLRRQAGEDRKLGQYVLQEKLGSGGMGEVYRAEHVLLRRPCALKLIHPERAGDPAALRRFEREMQITATLTHPNTVQVFDYGHAVDGNFYYVMEYLPELTLEELVCRFGPLPPARAVHFLRQVCAAAMSGNSATMRPVDCTCASAPHCSQF